MMRTKERLRVNSTSAASNLTNRPFASRNNAWCDRLRRTVQSVVSTNLTNFRFLLMVLQIKIIFGQKSPRWKSFRVSSKIVDGIGKNPIHRVFIRRDLRTWRTYSFRFSAERRETRDRYALNRHFYFHAENASSDRLLLERTSTVTGTTT